MDADSSCASEADELGLLFNRPVAIARTESPAHAVAFGCRFGPDGFFHGIGDLFHGRGSGRV